MSAKTQFLSSAALSYAATAPATAAHLMSRCQELFVSDSGTIPNSTSMISCVACGCIDLPGWTSHKEMATKNTSGSRRAMLSTKKLSTNATVPNIPPLGLTKSTVTTKVLTTQCLLCRRTAESSVQGKERPKKPPVMAEGSRKQDQVSDSTLRKEKRSKNRNKSGLMAILAKSKAASTPVPGLDLMDLMKVA